MNVLGIFLKQPVPGLVKSRLAAETGDDTAARFSEAFVCDLADRFRSTGDRRFLCYSPATKAALEFALELAVDDYELWLQPDGDLGTRMAHFFQFAVRSGGRSAILIGSDSPTLPRQYVENAFALLRTRDIAIVPATDGGYCLIGMRTGENLICHDTVFRDIDWSTPGVLSQTISSLAHAGASIGVLEPWYDVDDANALRMLRGHLRAMCAAQLECDVPRTMNVFQQVLRSNTSS